MGIRHSGSNRRVAGPASLPSGTVMLFYQETVPIGWTRVTTSAIDKHALVVDTLTALGSFTGTKGGANEFATALNGTVATVADAGSTPAHTHNFSYDNGASGGQNVTGQTDIASSKSKTTGGGSADGGTHTHAMDVDIAYVNMFLASKI